MAETFTERVVNQDDQEQDNQKEDSSSPENVDDEQDPEDDQKRSKKGKNLQKNDDTAVSEPKTKPAKMKVNQDYVKEKLKK